MRQLCHLSTLNELNALKNVTMPTGMYTFHITGIGPWTHIPAHIAHVCPMAIQL